MALCVYCGAPLAKGAKFCPSCGKRVPEVSAHTSTDGRGIVIDAPPGAEVIISDGPVDNPQFETEQQRPSGWGEFIPD